MKIEQDILNILGNSRIDGNIVYLPAGQLERKTYEAVNKCLTGIGGKWNRKLKGHVFDDNPIELFEELLLTGEHINLKQDWQFFETPQAVVKQMIELAGIKPGDLVLEPSAGKGAIIKELIKITPKVYYFELNPKFYNFLNENCVCEGVRGDFLLTEPLSIHTIYNKIVMNPPFSKQQDIDHILHAFKFLDKGGVLVSVASMGFTFRTNKKSVEFREFLEEHNAEVIKLPENAFKESGTNIQTVLIKIVN